MHCGVNVLCYLRSNVSVHYQNIKDLKLGGLVVHTHNPIIQKQGQENQEFKVNFGYIVSWRPV
ncbi:mCG147110 [Mus musculus]|nr:mCG147110 [Mus musculus]